MDHIEAETVVLKRFRRNGFRVTNEVCQFGCYGATDRFIGQKYQKLTMKILNPPKIEINRYDKLSEHEEYPRIMRSKKTKTA
ncbi:unnamed protein product, partial [Nesidiocoris tenuis]